MANLTKLQITVTPVGENVPDPEGADIDPRHRSDMWRTHLTVETETGTDTDFVYYDQDIPSIWSRIRKFMESKHAKWLRYENSIVEEMKEEAYRRWNNRISEEEKLIQEYFASRGYDIKMKTAEAGNPFAEDLDEDE